MKSDYATPIAEWYGYIAEAKRIAKLDEINNAKAFSGRHKK